MPCSVLFFIMADSVSCDTEAQSSGDPSSKHGGWITFPYLIVTLLGMSITSFGWLMNLIVFLMEEFNIKSIAAAQISNIFNGCLNMLPVVVAIIADSFFGNIPIVSASAFISLIGILLLTLIASLDYLRPQPYETPSKLQLGFLYAALALLTTGTGGTRITLASAGANQFHKPKDQGSFFNWYFLAVFSGAITGATAIVYTQDNASWKLGFGLCAAANFISFIVFVCGKRLYKHDKPMGSPFTSMIRVIVAATAKRKAVEEHYHYNNTSPTVPSKSFRFLNRAALKTEDGSVSNIWRLCSVQEVEDLKAVLRVIVEAKRLTTVGNEHPISVMWLFPPLVIVGIGEAFQLPANIELFYREFPESLKNTAASLTSLTIGISFYMSTALIDLIKRITEWLPDDINRGRVDNVYWLLVVLGVLNFGYFLVCCWFFTYRNVQGDVST